MNVLMSMHLLNAMIKHIILPQIGVGQDFITPYKAPTVLWKRHTGNPLCCGSMIPNIIIPQIVLAQENMLKKKKQTENKTKQRKHTEKEQQKRREDKRHTEG